MGYERVLNRYRNCNREQGNWIKQQIECNMYVQVYIWN